jgi:hypothetical protein
MALVILYAFSVWYVCKHHSWAHKIVSLALKPGVTLEHEHPFIGAGGGPGRRQRVVIGGG